MKKIDECTINELIKYCHTHNCKDCPLNFKLCTIDWQLYELENQEEIEIDID